MVLRSLALIVLVLGVGGALGGVLMALREDLPRRELSNLPLLVESKVVQKTDVIERFLGYGSAVAVHRANLASEVASTVVERVDQIRAGSPVVKDQVLIRFDDRQYRHALERTSALVEAEQAAMDELDIEARNLRQLIKTAELELRVAQDEKTRVSGLFERDLAARKEYDFASLSYQRGRRVLQGYQREAARLEPRRVRLSANKRGYEAEAALAQLNIERCQIESPLTGRIGALLVDTGDRVGPGTLVVTVIDASRVEVAVQLPAAVYDRVDVGASCVLESESTEGVLWRGDVGRIAPVADERTRTFAVYVIVDNRKQSQPLVPGTFVRAHVHGPVYHSAILVPRRACRGGRVFVVEDGIARARSVTTLRLVEENAVVTGGLHNADRIILSPLNQVADGMAVRVNPALSAASKAADPSQPESLDTSP